MIKSMTGFGSKEKEILLLGKVAVELRSTNHKFFDIVFHLPEELIALEDKIKTEIAGKIKRGRVTCAINIIKKRLHGTCVNKPLLKSYITALRNIKTQFAIAEDIRLDTLIHLPGVLYSDIDKTSAKRTWPQLKILLKQALEELMLMRQKEGRALSGYLGTKAAALEEGIARIQGRFTKVTKDKIAGIKTDEERTAFLKETDITEEIERFTFHVKNFSSKIIKAGPIGKELDFIAQEMQREANTIGAKSCDIGISAQVVQIKSQIEKIREQLQNIE